MRVKRSASCTGKNRAGERVRNWGAVQCSAARPLPALSVLYPTVSGLASPRRPMRSESSSPSLPPPGALLSDVFSIVSDVQLPASPRRRCPALPSLLARRWRYSSRHTFIYIYMRFQYFFPFRPLLYNTLVVVIRRYDTPPHMPALPTTAPQQVDRRVTEVEFIRRRLEGGALYALLADESSNYLQVGPFADADMELLGTTFAKVRALSCLTSTMDGRSPLDVGRQRHRSWWISRELSRRFVF